MSKSKCIPPTHRVRFNRYTVITAVAVLILTEGCTMSSPNVADVSRWKIPTSVSKEHPKITPARVAARVADKNMYSYMVHGKRYWVKDAAVGYRQTGIASWYGKKFHGRLTANQEVYDMYELTAAHKSLPLPSYIKVFNHNNNKSVIVRVNDRGPFVEGRIVDLSYAAAKRIAMDKSGLAPVTIEVIDISEYQKHATLKVSELSDASRIGYIQVGTYRDIENAFNTMRLLKKHYLTPSIRQASRGGTTAMHSVRLGPFQSSQELQAVGRLLDSKGFKDYRVFYR